MDRLSASIVYLPPQKDMFDLQAAQEKITRFERRIRARVGEAAVLYPNILGGAFRDAMEHKKGLRMRPQVAHPQL